MNRHAAVVRDCLGGTYRVIYVGEDGRPELDVYRTAAAYIDPGSVGFSISIEPECVVLVSA